MVSIVCVCVCVCVCVHVCVYVCVCVKHRCSAVLCAGNLINMMVDEMHMKVNGSCVEERIHFYSAVSQHQNTMK